MKMNYQEINNYKDLEEYCSQYNNIVIVTGAGISTLSGIPDYSSLEGIYSSKEKRYVPCREVLSRKFFSTNELLYWKWHNKHFIESRFFPNEIHNWITSFSIKHINSNELNNVSIITQNIDGLQSDSFKSHNVENVEVVEFHGNAHEFVCDDCSVVYSVIKEKPNACWVCKSPCISPNIVLYGDNISNKNYTRSNQLLRSADLILVMGTSLEVYPLSGLVLFNGEENVLWIDKKVPEPYFSNMYVKFIKRDFIDFFEITRKIKRKKNDK